MKFKSNSQRRAVMAKLFHARKGTPTPPPAWMAKESSGKLLTPKECEQMKQWDKRHKSCLDFKSADEQRLESRAKQLSREISVERRRIKK